MKAGRFETIEGRNEISLGRIIVDVRSNDQKFKDWLGFPSNFGKAMLGVAVVVLLFPPLLMIFLLPILFFIDAYTKNLQYQPIRYAAWTGLKDPGQLDAGTDEPTLAAGIMFFGIVDAKDPYQRGRHVMSSADDLTRHMLVLGTTGSGKAQPLDAKVHTPTGWRRMGDIKVGDLVSTPSGGSAPVKAVYPQGAKDIFRVTFADGRSTETCAEHLWEVHHKHWNGKYKPGQSRVGCAKPRVLSTLALAAQLEKSKGAFKIRLPDPIEKPVRELPLHPYLMGLLLGDGNMSDYLRYSTADEELVEAFAEMLPETSELNSYEYESRYTYWIRSKKEHSPAGRRNPDGSYMRNPVKVILNDLGLMGCVSHTKFIPEMYREASIAQRQMLLQGLMDTDGYAGSTCASLSYSSTSLVLAQNVQELVRSLGGIASISSKVPTYTYKGEKRTVRLCYNVNIRHPNPQSLFRLERKRKGLDSYQYAETLKLAVSKIELIGQKEAQCIHIDDTSHLYVTDDYVVTHNSEFLKGMTFNIFCWGSGFFVADAKADNKLPTDMYSQARMFGRDADMLFVNYLLGGNSPQKIANMRERLSNGMQPATAADADTLVQMTSNMMVKAGGDGKAWQERGLNVYRGICRALAHKRDLGELSLSMDILRDYLNIEKIEELYIEGWKLAGDGVNAWQTPYLGVKSYLEVGLPGFKIDVMLRKHKLLKEDDEDEAPQVGRGVAGPPKKAQPTTQSNEVANQHGYRSDQVYPALSLLIDTYGHIFRRKYAEVDMQDVVVNKRICVSLIPSLEKGSQEQESLGKLNLALLRVMMSRALGSSIEGDIKVNVDAKITASETPFGLFLDEFAYQFAEGIALTAAQARSLNFLLCALAQDLEKLTEGERAAEAGAMMANMASKYFMKIVGSDKTHELAAKTIGEATVPVLNDYEKQSDLTGSVKRGLNYRLEKRPRISREVMEELPPGFATFAYRQQAHVMRTFYASAGVPRVRYPRINRFLQIGDVTPVELAACSIDLKPSQDKLAIERVKHILYAQQEVNYGDQISSDLLQAICNASKAMNDQTPAMERGIVLYQAGLEALALARQGIKMLGKGAAGQKVRPATPNPVGADVGATPVHSVHQAVFAGDAGSGLPVMPVQPVGIDLGDEVTNIEDLLNNFNPMMEVNAQVLTSTPPITRKPKEDVFPGSNGDSDIHSLFAELTDGANAAGAEQGVRFDGINDAHVGEASDDTGRGGDSAHDSHGGDDDLVMADPDTADAASAATTSANGVNVERVAVQDTETTLAGLKSLTEGQLDQLVIESFGNEVVGVRAQTKEGIIAVEMALGHSEEAANVAADSTEKAVAVSLTAPFEKGNAGSDNELELFDQLNDLITK